VVGVDKITPVFWMGSSRADLKSFPEPVQSDVGYALFAAQRDAERHHQERLTSHGEEEQD
jgi:phage-related protein